MKKIKIFLCDLTHTSQGINSELIPYAIGCIKSYFHHNSSIDADIKLYKYPDLLAADFPVEMPEIVGFSNYMWNLDLSYTMACAIKKRNPATMVIFGGPNYPLEVERQHKWLYEHSAVDLYVAGEGEEPFLKIVEIWHAAHSIDAVKQAKIDGVHALIDGQFCKTCAIGRDGYDDSPRVKNIDDTPSPYLQGYLDEFLNDEKLVPLMESNRGCPFSCAFCVDGITSRSKVNKVSLLRLESELMYIIRRYKGKYLTLADTNFGMYKEDVEFCKVLARVKKQHDYPHHLQVSTGKNKQDRIIECAQILDGSLRLSASVQSLDPKVLECSQRSNISYQALIKVSERLSNTQTNTYSEVILGLPLDSKEKFIDSVCGLIDINFNQVRMFTFMVLDGSNLATNASRNKYKMKTKFRVVPRSFGIYEFMGENMSCVEIEEVCVEQDTLSLMDYIESRCFALTVTLFYNDKVFFELIQFLQEKGIRISDWIRFVHSKKDGFTDKLIGIYDSFINETGDELYESKEVLEELIKGDKLLINKYIDGEVGNNVLFNTQAKAYLQAMNEIHDIAFDAAFNLLELNGMVMSMLEVQYINELKIYSLMKKGAFTDLDAVYDHSFGFDFVAYEGDGFSNIEIKIKPVNIRFYYADWQKSFFSNQMSLHGTSQQGLGKLLSRVPIKKTHRAVKYA